MSDLQVFAVVFAILATGRDGIATHSFAIFAMAALLIDARRKTRAEERKV